MLPVKPSRIRTSETQYIRIFMALCRDCGLDASEKNRPKHSTECPDFREAANYVIPRSFSAKA